MKITYQDDNEQVTEIIKIAKAVRLHLEEPNCPHSIQTIIREALKRNYPHKIGESELKVKFDK